MNLQPRPGVSCRPAGFCFVAGYLTKQKLAAMKPFSAFREGGRKPRLVTCWLTNNEPKRLFHLGTVMIKALSAIAVAAFVAAGLTILPGFAPQVEASVPQALAKGDRLDIHAVGPGCSEHAWPNFEASCLRRAGTKGQTNVREARLVTADRTP